jgi:rhodanese-related sulfurtransferase
LRALSTIDPAERPYQNVSIHEVQDLLRAGATVLDVRTPREFAELGHLPGALLLPVELVPSAPAVLPGDGRPVLVVCEHGIRSRQASAWLADAGVPGVHNVAGGMSGWTGQRDFGPAPVAGPSPWLLSNAMTAPRGARTLDVACGRGRHALLLATAGFPVRAIDRDPLRVAELERLARRLHLPLETAVMDVENGAALGEEEWELILVFDFLHRPLFPALARALRPGGVLLYETYTREQATRGRPTRPEHLLEPGELPRLVAPLEVVHQREGDFEGAYRASVVARRPSRSSARSHSRVETSTARTPAAQRRPARSRKNPSTGRARRTPSARKR